MSSKNHKPSEKNIKHFRHQSALFYLSTFSLIILGVLGHGWYLEYGFSWVNLIVVFVNSAIAWIYHSRYLKVVINLYPPGEIQEDITKFLVYIMTVLPILMALMGTLGVGV